MHQPTTEEEKETFHLALNTAYKHADRGDLSTKVANCHGVGKCNYNDESFVVFCGVGELVETPKSDGDVNGTLFLHFTKHQVAALTKILL
jgi:hypothetical protein